MKVLANDGVSLTGVKTLKSAGFEVSTENVLQDNLIDHWKLRILGSSFKLLLYYPSTT